MCSAGTRRSTRSGKAPTVDALLKRRLESLGFCSYLTCYCEVSKEVAQGHPWCDCDWRDGDVDACWVLGSATVSEEKASGGVPWRLWVVWHSILQVMAEVDRLWVSASREHQEGMSPVVATIENVSEAWKVNSSWLFFFSLCFAVSFSWPWCSCTKTLQSALATRHHVVFLEDKLVKMKVNFTSAKKEQGRLDGVSNEAKDVGEYS